MLDVGCFEVLKYIGLKGEGFWCNFCLIVVSQIEHYYDGKICEHSVVELYDVHRSFYAIYISDV